MLTDDIEAEAHSVGFHGLGSVGHIFEDRVFVLESRIRVTKRNESSIGEGKVRESPCPGERTCVRARDTKLLAHSLIGGSREEQLMRLRDAKSGVDQERGTDSVGSGSRHCQRGAVLQVVAGSRCRKAAVSA